ncbi:MAG: response regulator transcription factor, partial [Bdellovibrionaceae bacterium]|nr:response regulator transcription factor [Pseudobdellovibrionaceae bacterium]
VEERIRALEMGADDFISKPFHAREFELRVRGRLESKGNFQSELTAGALRIDLLSRQVFLFEKEISLTPKQFELLKILVANQNCLVTREIFLKEVWGDTKVSPRNIDSQLNYLKKKLK